ncbi:MAG: YggS family pyridoxal phosphate-dependent enzyme [Planctomycetes bacterium]|nr:YggS family pyridoxal phosphate-dependent enzyme [Planctomycetota bacterium]
MSVGTAPIAFRALPARSPGASLRRMGESTATAPLDAASASALRDRWNSVRDRVSAAAGRSGRKASDVMLVVVTKSGSIDQIRELVNMGQVDLAENRVQQLTQRAATIGEWLSRRSEMDPKATVPQVRWHMIGSLQRNKVRKAMDVSRLVHSMDSLRLAEEMQAAASRRPTPMEVLVEVNVSGEASKSGIAPPAVRHMLDQMDTMVNLKVRGLMCMAPLSGGQDEARRTFERCKELFDDCRRSGSGGDRFDILSMGMSGDFEVAIECGANLVRVGGAVIGPPQVEEAADEA